MRITDGTSPYLNIFDIAFHPNDGMAYSVDNRGRLYRIDPSSGAATELSNVGQRGTFGAVYFDVGGNLYFSNNKTGRIYQVDLTDPNPTAVYFSQGRLLQQRRRTPRVRGRSGADPEPLRFR